MAQVVCTGQAYASPCREGHVPCVQTLRHEGVRGLYKGVLLSSAGVSSYIAVSFAVYDELNGHLPKDRTSCSTWWFPAAKLGTGAAAGLAGQVCHPR